MEIIEIGDGIVKLKNITTTRRVRLSDFKESLLNLIYKYPNDQDLGEAIREKRTTS